MNKQQHLRWILVLVALIGLQVSAGTQSAKAFEVAMQATLGDRVSTDPTGGPSLSRALAELGLKLEPKNTPVDFIVIDRIEQPTPN